MKECGQVLGTGTDEVIDPLHKRLSQSSLRASEDSLIGSHEGRGWRELAQAWAHGGPIDYIT